MSGKPIVLPQGPSRALYGAIDFRCDAHDESTAHLRADPQDPSCCCRVRCDGSNNCPRAKQLCRKLKSCFAIDRSPVWATLKARPRWWNDAPGFATCHALHAKANVTNAGLFNRQWHAAQCDDFLHGAPQRELRRHKLVLDVGFHTGEDSLYFVSRGFDVLAIEANVALVRAGLRRPSLALAARDGQFRLRNAGIAASGRANVSFYVHRRHSEVSTFLAPPRADLRHFDVVQVPTLTCAELLREAGARAVHYLKVDIEGADGWCLRSLVHVPRTHLPAYVSTEDPMLLPLLAETLGYRRFKLVDQSLTRRGRRSFSGGLPEEAPSRDPRWPGAAIGRLNHTRWFTADEVRADPDFQRIRRTGKQRTIHEYDLHARLSATVQHEQ